MLAVCYARWECYAPPTFVAEANAPSKSTVTHGGQRSNPYMLYPLLIHDQLTTHLF
jgi:hypothetical protein